MAFVLFILGIIVARLFWRQLLMAGAWLLVLTACYLLLRAAPAIGVAPSWLSSFYGATILGLVAGVLLGWRIVINYLVERDYDRDVERARGTADKRRV